MPPVFSHEAGFYDLPFQLTLSHADPDVRIFYTLDGSVPDPDNLDGTSYRYKNAYAESPGDPSGALLSAQYQTYAYKDATFIRDGRSEPNRQTNISTTLGTTPTYFPGPIVADEGFNVVIRHVNRAIRQINRLCNRARRALREKLSDGDVNHVQKIYISSVTYRPPYQHLYKGSVVRAVAVDVDGVRSPVVTRSFFIGKNDDFTLPIVSLVVPPRDLFDYADGILVAGKDYDDWLNSDDFVADERYARPANWGRRGTNTQAHLSIFDVDQRRVVASTDVDIRLHGNYSRIYPLKSFRVYPRARYNVAGLACDLFNTGKSIGLNRLVLRNAGNEYSRTYLKDAAIQQMMTGLSFGTQRYAPVVAFLNGEYYGVLNARDRIDPYYLADTFNLPSRKVDFLKNDKNVSRGDSDHWDRVWDYVAEHPKGGQDFLDGLETLVDVDSFIDYYAANIFIANTDWPGNNNAYWRYRGRPKDLRSVKAEVASGAPTPAGARSTACGAGPADGRWRWLMYDTDDSFRPSGDYGVEHNALVYATQAGKDVLPNPDWSTFMFRTVLKNPQFRDRFITRFSDLLNSTFLLKRMVNIIRQIQAGIEPEMPRHIHRWSTPSTLSRWRARVDGMVEFAEKRPAIQRDQLQEFFDLGPLFTLSVDVSDATAGAVRVNTLNLGQGQMEPWRQGSAEQALVGQEVHGEGERRDDGQALVFPWKGQYFQGLPIQLEALPVPGYRFSHWEAQGLSQAQAQDPVLTLEPTEDVTVRAVMVISLENRIGPTA